MRSKQQLARAESAAPLSGGRSPDDWVPRPPAGSLSCARASRAHLNALSPLLTKGARGKHTCACLPAKETEQQMSRRPDASFQLRQEVNKDK